MRHRFESDRKLCATEAHLAERCLGGKINACVAQLVEHLPGKKEAVGSRPTVSFFEGVSYKTS